jgi:hypothetical protein
MRKKILLVLEKLRRDPTGELKAMSADLERQASNHSRVDRERTHWTRRFRASGKSGLAPRIRVSYEP